MAFTPSTTAPDDVQAPQGTGHLTHHQRLRAAVMELRSAGLALETEVPELARDAVGAALTAGSNVSVAVNDAGDTITISATNTTDQEVVRDTIAAALVAGTGVSIVHDDAANTITITATGGGSTDPEVVRDTVAAALRAGTGISISSDDAGDTITITATGGGGGGTSPGGARVFKVVDYVEFDGTTNIRAGFQSALDAAVAVAQAGGHAVVEMPAGIGPITTVTTRDRPILPGSSSQYSSATGFGLPVNLTGHLTIRGQGMYATTVKLSANCRSLFWIDKQADYDVFRNVTFEDFAVDNNGATAQCQIICGTVSSSNTPLRRLSLFNLTHRRLRVFGVPRDETWDPAANGGSGQYTMPNTKKAAFVYHSKQNGDYESGTTPGQLPLTPYPGIDGAHAAKWNYVVGLTFEDIRIIDAQRGILVVSDITQNSSIWYDDIVMRRCHHEQSAPWPAWAPQTSFYIGGNCQGQRAEVTDCTSINIGDDGIEFGGMQELIVNNFRVVNPFLDGILVRYSQPPLNPAGVRILVDGFLQTIDGAVALNNDTITRSDNSTARRSFRGRPFEVKVEDGGALANLGEVVLRNCKTIVDGGYHGTFNRSGLVGWNSSGAVTSTLIENCEVVLRNFTLDQASGETVVELFTVRATNIETGALVATRVENARVTVENITSNGAKYELHGFTPSGDGEVHLDGLLFEIRNAPSTAVVRMAMAMVGHKATAYSSGANRTLQRLILRGMRASLVGSVVGVRRGVVVKADEPVDYAQIDGNDLRNWSVNGDIDKANAGTNAPKLVDGRDNWWYQVPDQGRRNPQAANYTIRAHDRLVAVTSTSAARTLTLPAVASVPPGRPYVIVDESRGAATNNITVAAASGETFVGGAASYVINTNGGAVEVYSNGANWVAR